MAVTVYRSTDTSAPVLSGTVGTLINLLDKCLVAGYGSQVAAGWTKPFTGTNTAVFRMGGGNQFYIDVLDNGPGTGAAREARVRGYETMTAVSTGTGPFPTVAQVTNGDVIRKSLTADATARVWTLIADDRTFYLFVLTGDTAGLWLCYSFGDLYSFLSTTDSYRALIMARTVEVAAGPPAASQETSDQGSISAQTGLYIARSHTGLGGASTATKVGDPGPHNSLATAYALLGALNVVPNPVDGRIWLSPVRLSTSLTSHGLRGEMRGFFHFLHNPSVFTDQDTVTGVGPYAGRTFLLFKTTTNAGVYCMDITGPWNVN